MNVLAFSDLHGDIHAAKVIVEKIKKVDVAIFCGDFSTFNNGIDQVADAIGEANNLLVIPGNHEVDEKVKNVCQIYNWIFLHGRIWNRNEYNFCGCGGSSPTPFNTPFEFSEDELSKILQEFQNIDDNIILITHCPPFGTSLDKTSSGEHAGSKAIRKFIEKKQPLLNICGHIHENSDKEDRIKDTQIICVGKRGTTIDL